jgi:hypothetical protein
VEHLETKSTFVVKFSSLKLFNFFYFEENEIFFFSLGYVTDTRTVMHDTVRKFVG